MGCNNAGTVGGLERKMPGDYKTLRTGKSLSLSTLVQVCAAAPQRDQYEPHGARARGRAMGRACARFQAAQHYILNIPLLRIETPTL